jgi:poly(hydroxyalkanoate) granule-associated protein
MQFRPAGESPAARTRRRQMLKKAKAQLAAGASGAANEKGKDTAKDLAQGVLDSSHQIWLAGLGAFAQAKQEGAKLFETLVKQGEELQDRTKRAATETAAAARGAATAKAKEMQQMAGGTWDKLEQVFEDRVARALSKLGVYTQNDVQRLAVRVDELAAAVNKLVKAPAGGGAAAKPAKRASRRKVAAAPAAKGRRRAPK